MVSTRRDPGPGARRTISPTLSRAFGRTALPTLQETFIHCVHQSLRSCQDFANAPLKVKDGEGWSTFGVAGMQTH